MEKIDWDYSINATYHARRHELTLEQLYQAFKARMEAEIKQREDNDFPLGEACDLSKEGGCESCQ